ncbi:Protein kinase [Mycena kentingensis (nom. inval.)]|nr:Protein kinase [Mycena kentingensis (nom. inval.)]
MYFSPVEDARGYKLGGLHPVHLGDTFSNGRYTVVHKLGYGATSTIWLVSDAQTSSLASLKIVSADRAHTELPVLLHLNATHDPAEEGSQYIAYMLDHFVHEGPNGLHQCFVQQVLGPSFCGSNMESLYEFWRYGRLPPEIAHRLCGQLALAVAYLHKRGVAHGDLHPGNVLLCLPSTWTSIEDVDREFGDPEYYETRVPPSPHCPEYLVGSLTSDRIDLLRTCLQEPNIKLCDFGEAYIAALPSPPRLATPHVFRPPEALPILAIAPHATPELDIWALGNLFCFLLCSIAPFDYGKCDDDHLSMMVMKLGPFPEPLWSKWEKRPEIFDPTGKAFDASLYGPRPLLLRALVYALPPGSKRRESFELLLRSILCYEAPKRIKAAEVLESAWFKEHCTLFMSPGDTYTVEHWNPPSH